MMMESQAPAQSLTPHQKEVLDFISSFTRKQGYSPTLKEIAQRFRKSIPTAQHHVEELEKKGYLRKLEDKTRGIIPIEEGSTEIPLLGYIAAGEPIEPLENPEPIAVPKTMVSQPGQFYALRVEGDSMIEDGILDRDVVVVKHQLTAEDGDTVVAVTEKGATLKILKKHGNQIYLKPRNKKLPNIYPKKIEIRGRFVGLIRK